MVVYVFTYRGTEFCIVMSCIEKNGKEVKRYQGWAFKNPITGLFSQRSRAILECRRVTDWIIEDNQRTAQTGMVIE